MYNKEFVKENEISRDTLVCEKWTRIKTDVGFCTVVRYWISKVVDVQGNKEEVLELLGYRGHLSSRKLMGNIFSKPDEAVDDVVNKYKVELEKQAKIVDGI